MRLASARGIIRKSLAKVIICYGRYAVDYGELLGPLKDTVKVPH